jgi:O-methyltransferase involved in polyketide biosynthesis
VRSTFALAVLCLSFIFSFIQASSAQHSAPTFTASTAASQGAASDASEEGKVVRYDLKMSELKYTYAASYQPVARLKSSNILETNTVDCFGNCDQEARRSPTSVAIALLTCSLIAEV